MRWILLILLTAQAATCGQKGPLTLPQNTSWRAAVMVESASSNDIRSPHVALR